MKKLQQPHLLIVFAVVGIIVLILIGILIWSLLARGAKQSGPTSFAECAAAGHPIMDSYPEQCSPSTGITFINTSKENVRVAGKIICLPHRDTSGPQTLECAFGIQAKDGVTNFGLSDTDFKYLAQMPTGAEVTVTGTFKQSANDNYNALGTIEITNVVRR